MAITNISTTQISSAFLWIDTALDATKQAIKAGSAVVYMIEVDNSANAAEAEWIKLYNLASGGVTVGTSLPDVVILVPAAAKFNITIPGGATFGTALTAAAVKDGGGTAGTTNPTAALIVKIVYV
jgi:hypothetical protein